MLAEDTGVRDREVEASPLDQRSLGERVHFTGRPDVDLVDDTCAARLLHAAQGLGRIVRISGERADHDPGSDLGQGHCGLEADTAGSTGHYRDLAAHVLVRVVHLS